MFGASPVAAKLATLAVKYAMYFEVHCVLRREVVCARSFDWSQTIHKWVGQVGRRWERIQTENIVEGQTANRCVSDKKRGGGSPGCLEKSVTKVRPNAPRMV